MEYCPIFVDSGSSILSAHFLTVPSGLLLLSPVLLAVCFHTPSAWSGDAWSTHQAGRRAKPPLPCVLSQFLMSFCLSISWACTALIQVTYISYLVYFNPPFTWQGAWWSWKALWAFFRNFRGSLSYSGVDKLLSIILLLSVLCANTPPFSLFTMSRPQPISALYSLFSLPGTPPGHLLSSNPQV